MLEKVVGKVVEGEKVGKTLGFPTLNLQYSGDLRGVFAAEAVIGGEKYLAAVSVGSRPTFGGEGVTCEAFLLNFDEDIPAGSELEVVLWEKIRDNKKFGNPDELKAQISKDVEFIKSWYTAKNDLKT